MAEIIVCGYPRSGNCWIARLFGEALDVKVVGNMGGRDSIAAEGEGRRGEGYVKQAHLFPGKQHHLSVDPKNHPPGIYLLMVRDPRDVAVSVAHYWDKSIDRAMDMMIEGPGPLELPPWKEFVASWLPHRVPILRYEDFHRDAEGELARVLLFLGLEPQKPLAEVVEHQSFEVKKAVMKRRGNRHPFGHTAQLKHLRKGETGEWREAMSIEQKRKALLAWGRMMTRLGYDENGV